MAWLISRALLEAFENSLVSPGRAAASSEANFLAGELSALLSGKDTPRAYLLNDNSTEPSNPFQSGTTYGPLMADLGAAVLTWCQEDSRARTSAPPAEGLASLVRVRDFGRTWHVLPAKWNVDMCAWKTAHSLLDEGWMKSLPTLPRWGFMDSDGQLWQRRMLVRRTSETESGSLPTPVKYDATATSPGNHYYHGLGWQTKHNPSFPTPTKYDGLGTWETNNNHGLGWTAKHVWADDPNAEHVWGTWYEFPDGRRFRLNDEPAEETGARLCTSQYGPLVPKSDGTRQVTLWPTPKALDANKRSNFNVDEKRNGLPGAVRKRVIWPTPLRNDAFGSGVTGKNSDGSYKPSLGRMFKSGTASGGGLTINGPVRKRAFPTPIANDAGTGSDAAGREGGASLKQVIARAVWPTPMTEGLRGGSGAPKDLEQRIDELQEVGMELNPEWVEWLMGWPFGWTSLDPMPEGNMAVWFGSMHGPVGQAPWWNTDPSVVSDMSRTCPKDLPHREDRIAALGNGQVPIVMAAAWIYLNTLTPPEE